MVVIFTLQINLLSQSSKFWLKSVLLAAVAAEGHIENNENEVKIYLLARAYTSYPCCGD